MPLRMVVGTALILGALVVVSVVTYFNNQVAYYTVDELVANHAIFPAGAAHAAPAEHESTVDASAQAEVIGRRVQVRGTVDKASVKRAKEGLEMHFTLTGKDGRIPVVYHGLVPDTFDLAEAVTVAGRVTAQGGFVADELFVQCPSRYQAKPPGEAYREAARVAA